MAVAWKESTFFASCEPLTSYIQEVYHSTQRFDFSAVAFYRRIISGLLCLQLLEINSSCTYFVANSNSKYR